MKIALAQVAPGNDRKANEEKGRILVADAARQGAEIVCFPEMSFCPFFPQYHAQPKYFDWAETVPGPQTELFQAACAESGTALIFNMFEKDGRGRYFDCSPVIDREGTCLGKSQMMHIAELPHYNEKYYYWEGTTDYPVFTVGQFTFGIAICYDRHYPEQIRTLTLKGADIIFVPTATSLPELRNIWDVEMQAASVTNQVFIAVVNRVGKDDTIKFFGKSFVTDPTGGIIAGAGEKGEELLLVDVDLGLIESTRRVLPFLRDRRPETYSRLTDR